MPGDRHPATTGLLEWFDYDHLPVHLQVVSKPVGDVARHLVSVLPDGPELSAGLRKLMEAKDCFVRAAVAQHRAAEDAAPHVPMTGRGPDAIPGPPSPPRPANDRPVA